MLVDISKNPKKIELHYNFDDNSHTMDAIIRNNCEREILAIVKEITSVLDIEIDIETEAFSEGGLKELWSIISKNQFVVGIITGILINVLSTYLTKDHELAELQKQEIRLNIEKLKRELQESNEDNPPVLDKEAIDILNKNLKISKHRSNFYKNINSYEKVIRFSTVILSNENIPVSEPKVIERKEFKRFILKTDDLPPFIDENANLEIVAPVLKKGRYKWKGIYRGEVIPFSIRDKEFKFHVINSDIQFKNGTSIDCVLEVSRKINDIGEIFNYGFTVLTVT